MLLIFVLLVLLVLGVALAIEVLANYTPSRLEKYCAARRARRFGAILDRQRAAAEALRLWQRALFLGLVAAALAAGFVQDERDRWFWIDRLLLVWLGYLGLQLWIGRQANERWMEPVLYHSWPAIDGLRFLALPVVFAARWVGRSIRPPGPPAEPSAAEPAAVGDAASAGSPNPMLMVNRILELPEVAVSEVMTPRTDMVMLRITTPIDEACAVIGKQGHSRIPVYVDNRDDIRGILYAKDLLPALTGATKGARDLTGIRLRKPIYVPETKPVDVLLREFQRQQVHLAIVLDEYGGVAGLVTIEDILEQIVGDIVDEYDEPELPLIARISDHVFEVDARAHVDEVNELVSLRFPEDADYDTIGGFVFSTLGYIPKPGESFQYDRATLTVLDASDRAIHRIRIELEAEGYLAKTSESAS